jgi:hypothetical protein
MTSSVLAGSLNWDGILTVLVIVILLVGVIAAGTAWQIWITGKVGRKVLSGPRLEAVSGVQRQRVRTLARISIRFLNATGFHRLARQLDRSDMSNEKET